MNANEKSAKCSDCVHRDAPEDACGDCYFGWGENPEISRYAEATHHDQHYQGRVQPLELMQAQMTQEEFIGFLRGNIIKYASRLGKKDDRAKEAEKILRYAAWLKEAVSGRTINPRK